MSPLGVVLVVILVLVLIGGFGGVRRGVPVPYGYYGVGGLGLVLVILLIFVVLGRV
jgi:hypothetical protein